MRKIGNYENYSILEKLTAIIVYKIYTTLDNLCAK